MTTPLASLPAAWRKRQSRERGSRAVYILGLCAAELEAALAAQAAAWRLHYDMEKSGPETELCCAADLAPETKESP